jgi:hypothetical protein
VGYVGGSALSEDGSTVTSSSDSRPAQFERAISTIERNWPWALGALMLLDAALLLYMGRGLSFFYDDWDFVTHDYGGGFHSLMAAHVGNISVFPVAVYKILFHVVGLNHYAVYRLVVIVLHLLATGLIFVLASRRIPRVPALLATMLILFLGAAWEDLLWAFQVGYMLSITGGLGAWVLLERQDRRGDAAAMLCLVVSAGSSSLGVAMMIGIAVELLWRRGSRQRIWIVLVPATLYLFWYLGYGESEVTRNSLINAPGYVEELIAAAFGGVLGRGLEWGRPLALVGVLLLLQRLARPVAVPARLAGLLATGIALWIVTAAARSTISPPETSRYIYLGAVVIVLVGVELLHRVAVSPRAVVLAVVVVVFSAVAGLTVMHAGALGRRENAETVTAELGALELAAAYAPPNYQPDPQGAPQIMAGPYLHTVRAIGSSPADTPAEIAAARPSVRGAADAVLMTLEVPRLVKVSRTEVVSTGQGLSALALVSGNQTRDGACVSLRPERGLTMTATFSLPSSGLLIRDLGNDPASVAVRRFGEGYIPVSSVAEPNMVTKLTISSDHVARPWQLQVVSSSVLSICGSAVGAA